MPRASADSFGADRINSSAPISSPETSGKYLIIPFLACLYALIVFPLLIVGCGVADAQCVQEARPENRIVWPALAAFTFILALNNRSRLTFPPHIICLFVYLAFAGASITWSVNPSISFIRFAQQVMIISSIILPAIIASRKTDMMRTLFLCFAFAAVLNMYYIVVAGRPPVTIENATWGYPGYFAGKNYLGECAGFVFLLALFEIIRPGAWRVLGIIIAVIAATLLYLSNSRTSLGLALIAPFLAGLTLIIRRLTRASPVVLPLTILSCYALLTSVTGFYVGRLSYIITGEPTFTGRMFIWDFANYEIRVKPLMGWGYQSFWLAGPGSPSIVEGPSWIAPWIRSMPNAHNGYLDTMLEMGYIGLVLLVIFLIATMHAMGRVADRDPARGWILLSLAYFVIVSNGLESTWMRSFEFVWVVFLFVAAEVARYGEPLPAAEPERQSTPDRHRVRANSAPGHRRSSRDGGYRTAQLSPVGADARASPHKGLVRGSRRAMVRLRPPDANAGRTMA